MDLLYSRLLDDRAIGVTVEELESNERILGVEHIHIHNTAMSKDQQWQCSMGMDTASISSSYPPLLRAAEHFVVPPLEINHVIAGMCNSHSGNACRESGLNWEESTASGRYRLQFHQALRPPSMREVHRRSVMVADSRINGISTDN